jgi:hypothetical protein
MCFSAEASFAAGAVLSAIGVATVKRVQQRSLIPFAIIPFLFGFQQIAEGILWLTFTNKISPDWQPPMMIVFLVFAQVIWPVWVPLALWIPERQPARRKILLALVAAGGALAAYHIFCLFNYTVTAEVAEHHINYTRGFPEAFIIPSAIIYVLTTVIAPFVSSVKTMNLLAVVLLVSFLVALFFYKTYLISVWCFFAAVISVMVLLVINASRVQRPVCR